MGGVCNIPSHLSTPVKTTFHIADMDDNGLICRALVVKIASRCNLNCTYCYMYNLGDETYKMQPKVMSDATIESLIQKVKTHITRHKIDRFTFVFHGGEPLLAGKEFITKFVSDANACLSEFADIRYSIQTNGVLLDEEWAYLLGHLNIHVGVSLDGLPEQNDKFRIDHAGRGSYKSIVAGLKFAQASTTATLPPGLLCVLDITSDPIKTYEHFKSLAADNVDFLLPDANYDKPPVLGNTEGITPYGDWLIAVFDRWRQDKNRISIRFFRNIMQSILGKPIGSDMLGSGHNEVLVIETNGDIESVDVLKICGHAFTKTNANVHATEFDEALTTPLARLYNLSHINLPKKCISCPVNDICGGGYLPHRFSSKNGFNNPTVYCKDFMKLITHIQNIVLGEFPPEILIKSGISILTYKDALEMVELYHMEEDPSYIKELTNYYD